MLVGAGLMFVLMHGEVSADSKEVPEKFVCSGLTVTYSGGTSKVYKGQPIIIVQLKIYHVGFQLKVECLALRGECFKLIGC